MESEMSKDVGSVRLIIHIVDSTSRDWRFCISIYLTRLWFQVETHL